MKDKKNVNIVITHSSQTKQLALNIFQKKNPEQIQIIIEGIIATNG